MDSVPVELNEYRIIPPMNDYEGGRGDVVVDRLLFSLFNNYFTREKVQEFQRCCIETT